MATDAGEDRAAALFEVADASYRAGDWAKAAILYGMLQAQHPAVAAVRGALIAAGHCRIELNDDVDPTAIAYELVPVVSAQAAFARIGPIRLRVLALCRAGAFARAMRLLLFLAGFDEQISVAFQESIVKGRTGCWEAPAEEPGFLRVDRWSEHDIDAIKARFQGRRVLIVMAWNAPFGPGDRYLRSARAFGLTGHTYDMHEMLGNLDPAPAAARLKAEIDAFRPEIILTGSLTELSAMPALVEQLSAVLEDARRRRGVRVVQTCNDAWMVPADRLTEGLGRSLDIVHHCHPALTQQQAFDPRTVYCYFHPVLFPVPDVAAGTIPRGIACGSFSFANPSRLLWWAQFGLSDLPLDFIETSVDGEGMLSIEHYVTLLREHQLTIGLTRRSSGVNIITGRTIETLLAGGVLVEEDSFDSRYFLKPGAHYIPFESWTDLRELVPWLLANPAYRERIARDGQAWVRRHFTGDWFWAGLLDRLYGT